MLNMLLQALVLDRPLAQRHILRLLCGLVANEDTQAEVVSSGVVKVVQAMGNRDTHASAISLILFNISCNAGLAGRCANVVVGSKCSGFSSCVCHGSIYRGGIAKCTCQILGLHLVAGTVPNSRSWAFAPYVSLTCPVMVLLTFSLERHHI